MEFIASLDILRWLAISGAAFLAGITKAGMDSGTILAVPLLTALFGGRGGSSVMLGMADRNYHFGLLTIFCQKPYFPRHQALFAANPLAPASIPGNAGLD